MTHAIRSILCVLACAAAPAVAAGFEPLLVFMQPEDAVSPSGMLIFEANPLRQLGQVEPIEAAIAQVGAGRPISAYHPLGSVPIDTGGCHVYACTHQEAGTEPRTFNWQVFRGTTPDGYHVTEWQEVFRNPQGPWLIESMVAYQQAARQIFFFTWSRHPRPEEGHALWGFASPDGLTWRPLSDEPLYTEHDAFGGMWDARTGRFLTAQVTQEAFNKPHADNIGRERRRVLSIRTSQDGVHWEQINEAGPDGMITPDANDPPDVEFYRMQPFHYADRYLGVANLYAASPLVPAKHGPHLACEWWTSADGIRWQRPWRSVAAQGEAPYAVKMTPMWFGQEMLFWIAGQVMGLPEYRVASIGARSNAEFSSRLIEMPARPLLLNASAPAGQGLFNQAYVAVELRDEADRTIPGYEYDKCVLRAVDDTRIPLRWETRDGTELAGRKIRLRFYLRSARIYALGH